LFYILRPPRPPLFPYTTLFRSLGSNVNSKGGEVGPTLFEDDVTGTITLYFSSDPSGGEIADGRFDIYASTLGADESFGPAVIVRSEEHTSELQSRFDLVCRLLL